MLFIAIPCGLSCVDEQLANAYFFGPLLGLWIAGFGLVSLTSGIYGYRGRVTGPTLLGIIPILIGMVCAVIGVIEFLRILIPIVL